MSNPTTTVLRFCVFCNAERQVHTETGRCQTCGRSTATSKVLPLNGMTSAPVARTADPAPEKLVLTETPALRKWVEQTKALAVTFKERAEKSERFAERFQAEGKQLALAASAFAGLVAQIGIEPKELAARGRLNGRWALRHDVCVKCGKTDRPHKAHGFCERCHRSKP